MYGTHTLAFQRIFVRMKIIALIFIRFSYVSLIRNSVTGPLKTTCNSACDVTLSVYPHWASLYIRYVWIYTQSNITSIIFT